MRWYRLVKLADAASKISKFSIDNPLAQSIVYRYEGALPWNDFASKEQNKQVFNDEIKHQVYKLEDAMKNMSEDISSNFSRWTNYIDYTIRFMAENSNMAGRDNLDDIVSFAKFVFFKPMLSFAKNKRYIPLPDYGIISDLIQLIQNDPKQGFNVFKEYTSRFKNDHEDGWYKFEGGTGDSHEEIATRKENAKVLSDFVKGSGWCIAEDQTAFKYLDKHSLTERGGQVVFHVLVENKKPAIAILMNEKHYTDDGEDTKLMRTVGIYGPMNEQPSWEYYPETKKKILEEGSNTSDDSNVFDSMKGQWEINNSILKVIDSGGDLSESKVFIARMANNYGPGSVKLLDERISDHPILWLVIKDYILNYIIDSGTTRWDLWSKKWKDRIPVDEAAKSFNNYLGQGGNLDYSILSKEILNNLDKTILADRLKNDVTHGYTSIEELPEDLIQLISAEDVEKIIKGAYLNDVGIAFREMTGPQSNNIKSDTIKRIVSSPEFKEFTHQLIRTALTNSSASFSNLTQGTPEREYWVNEMKDTVLEKIMEQAEKAVASFEKSNLKEGYPLQNIIDHMVKEYPKLTTERALKSLVDTGDINDVSIYVYEDAYWNFYYYVPAELAEQAKQMLEDYQAKNIYAKIILSRDLKVGQEIV